MAGRKLGGWIFALFISATNPALAETIVALMSDNKLQHFDSGAPGTFTRTINLTGIPGTESVAALDFRPDGSLVVATREGGTQRFYFVNPITGAAADSNFEVATASANAVAFDAYPAGIHPNVDLAVTTDNDLLIPFSITQGGFGGDGNRTLIYDSSASDGDPADEHAVPTHGLWPWRQRTAFPADRRTCFTALIHC